MQKILHNIKKLLKHYQIWMLVLAVGLSALLLKNFPQLYKLSPSVEVIFTGEQNKDLEYQVYYTETSDEVFNEKQSVKKMIPAGKHQVTIAIPVSKIVKFRLDTGVQPGKVILSNLCLDGKEKIDIGYSDLIFRRIDKFSQDKKNLVINSNQNDPLLVYNKSLNLEGKYGIDWLMLIIVSFISFLISYQTVRCLVKFKILEKS